MSLVGFQYEHVSLDVNEVYFEQNKNRISLIIHEKNQRKRYWKISSVNVTRSAVSLMKNFLFCAVGVEALGYFQLSNRRYDDGDMVTERVRTRVLQLYLILTPKQILEHVVEYQRRI